MIVIMINGSEKQNCEGGLRMFVKEQQSLSAVRDLWIRRDQWAVGCLF